MTRDSRKQPPSKESQEHASTKRDEHKELPSPDTDFPKPSSGTGEEGNP